ncbi:MAG: hypothetical protein WCO57_07095 [Verrucomicrobiota bacterium]
MIPARATPQSRSELESALLFRWRGRPKAHFPKLVPFGLAALAFAFLLTLVQVKVAAPQFEMTRKASWMLLPTRGEGALWAMRAKENGPSLASYQPAEWQAYAGLAAEVLEATRIPAYNYVPKLRALPPEGPLEPLQLTAKGETVLPHRAAAPTARDEGAAWRLAPMLYPLSVVATGELPRTLPPLQGEIDTTMAGTDWRFLLRLHPAGGVAECVVLTKTPGSAATLLENWLRGVTFDPKLAADGGWIAVGLRFNNQPAHGTEHH